VKSWEIIADNLKQSRLELGLTCGRTIWIADAHRGDRKRYIVRANEIPTAFIELESVIRNHVNNSAF